MIIDSHAHLTSSDLFNDLDGVLSRAKAAGVYKIINIATDLKSLNNGLLLSKEQPWIFNAAAIHPHDADKDNDLYFETIQDNLNNLHAIGETGLDYFYKNSPKEIQIEQLQKHLELAERSNLPVVIHCREAFSDFFKVLDDFKKVKGVLHCFTGTLDEAKEVVRRGFYLSLSGIVTFKKSTSLHEVAAWVPAEKLLVETDSPYLAPQSKRGKSNEPAFVVETAQFIADQKQMPFEQLASITSRNTETLFNL